MGRRQSVVDHHAMVVGIPSVDPLPMLPSNLVASPLQIPLIVTLCSRFQNVIANLFHAMLKKNMYNYSFTPNSIIKLTLLVKNKSCLLFIEDIGTMAEHRKSMAKA